MAGRDTDVDVRDFSATDIAVLRLGGADYLAGRGGSPASIPGPATARVAMVAGEGDDTPIDGPDGDFHTSDIESVKVVG